MRLFSAPPATRRTPHLVSRHPVRPHAGPAHARGRLIELDAGSCLIGPAPSSPTRVRPRSPREPGAEFGLVEVDTSLADRLPLPRGALVGRPAVGARRPDRHGAVRRRRSRRRRSTSSSASAQPRGPFQPIVDLATGQLHEWECLFRPVMPMLPRSITAIVAAAIDTNRSVELDAFIVAADPRSGSREIDEARPATAPTYRCRSRLDQLHAGEPARPAFEASAFADLVEAHGLSPRQITLECTEQQAVSDVVPLKRQVKALAPARLRLRRRRRRRRLRELHPHRRAAAIDHQDRPGDRERHRRRREAGARRGFVSFGRRIGAQLVAEGIETRSRPRDARRLGVEFGQGYLIGKPAADPSSRAGPRCCGSRVLGNAWPQRQRERNVPRRSSAFPGLHFPSFWRGAGSSGAKRSADFFWRGSSY